MQHNPIISKTEYAAISRELQQLKARKDDLTSKLNNENLDFIRGFDSVDRWLAWREDAKQMLDEVAVRMAHLRELAHVYLGAARINNAKKPMQPKAWRQQFLSSTSGISRLLIAARVAIEELNEDGGDNWKDEHRAICANLHALERTIRGDSSFSAWLSPDEVRALRERYETAATRSEATYRQEVIKLQRTIADLQSEIARERATKGRATVVLRRLKDLMFAETEDWRLRRGYTHRISLTRDMCDEINEVA